MRNIDDEVGEIQALLEPVGLDCLVAETRVWAHRDHEDEDPDEIFEASVKLEIMLKDVARAHGNWHHVIRWPAAMPRLVARVVLRSLENEEGLMDALRKAES